MLEGDRLGSRRTARRRGPRAFSLVELIVVLLVLGVMTAIAVPTFGRVTENSVVRAAQTTLEVAARNGEAMARSDQDATDEAIASAVESEFADGDGLTVSVGTGAAADTVTVTQIRGSVVASGAVEFVDGAAVITAAAVTGSGASTTTTGAPAPSFPGIGDVGPGGGIVFYVDLAGFACGPTLAATCTYLEAAPNDIAGYVPPQYSPTTTTGFTPWCDNTTLGIGVTATAIGTGMANTTTADALCTSGAIQLAADYTNNGYADWFLPSKDELNELNVREAAVGNFDLTDPRYGTYWSSSETGGGSANDGYAVARYFHFGGSWFDYLKAEQLVQVRPVRAG